MTTHQQRPAGQATFYQQQAPAGHHPQQGYPGQQPPTSFPPPYQQGGQPQPPKKRRRWPWVLGALIVLIVIISAANGGGSNTTTPTTTPGVAAPAAPAAAGQSAASAPASAAAAAPTYTYKVTGSGSATVMYTGKGGQMSQSTQKLPWSKTVDRDQFLSFGMVSATVMNAKGPLTCTITDENGQVVGQNTADGGDFATVSCNSNGS